MDIRRLGRSCFPVGAGGSTLLIVEKATSSGVVLDPGGSHSL